MHATARREACDTKACHWGTAALPLSSRMRAYGSTLCSFPSPCHPLSRRRVAVAWHWVSSRAVSQRDEDQGRLTRTGEADDDVPCHVPGLLANWSLSAYVERLNNKTYPQ